MRAQVRRYYRFVIVELRQYTLVPGQREVLIELFEAEFIESQEALGMRILGTFRDLEREDRFVWLRGFTDMRTRLAGLSDFYGGPVWAEHGPLANTTMLEFDDVLLLHDVTDLDLPAERTRLGAPSEVIISVHERSLMPDLDPGLGLLESEEAVNDFPTLPVRRDVDAAVRIGRDVPPVPTLQVLRLEPTSRSLLR